MFEKLSSIIENGSESECGQAYYEYVEETQNQAKIKAVAQNENENTSDFSELVEAFKIFRREITGELTLLRNAINRSLDTPRNPRPERFVSLFTKTPLANTMDELDDLESKLTDPEYRAQMINELVRYKGNGLQSSLSHMIDQLLSKQVLKEFCYRGSKGVNKDEIPKKSFKNTNCFDVIKGN